MKKILFPVITFILLISLYGCRTKGEVTMSAVSWDAVEQQLTLLIENGTKERATYGMEWTIEFLDGDEWHKLKMKEMTEDGAYYYVPSMGVYIEPGNSREETIHLTAYGELAPGQYRACKQVSADDETTILTAEFSVDEPEIYDSP